MCPSQHTLAALPAPQPRGQLFSHTLCVPATIYWLPSPCLSPEGSYFCMLHGSQVTYISCPPCTSAERVVISACFVHPGCHILAALPVPQLRGQLFLHAPWVLADIYWLSS